MLGRGGAGNGRLQWEVRLWSGFRALLTSLPFIPISEARGREELCLGPLIFGFSILTYGPIDPIPFYVLGMWRPYLWLYKSVCIYISGGKNTSLFKSNLGSRTNRNEKNLWSPNQPHRKYWKGSSKQSESLKVTQTRKEYRKYTVIVILQAIQWH